MDPNENRPGDGDPEAAGDERLDGGTSAPTVTEPSTWRAEHPPRGPGQHKEAAKRLGLKRVTDLLALAPKNDPFYTGTPADRRNAQWFADLWREAGYTRGVHLRRVHYRLVSTRGRTATGESYDNTDQCWSHLLDAGKAARALRLVDPEAFVDRRNDPPRIYVASRESPAEPVAMLEPPFWRVPTLDVHQIIGRIPRSFTMPDLDVYGYDYEPADQPVLVEVWIEKSTMDDVLRPVCAAESVNLLSGSGFQSITAVISLLRRTERHGRPAHVLYVSDLDPAGVVMPLAIARQAQFWAETLKIDAELSIETLALTREQVDRYSLPRAPIKVDKNGKADQRGKRFEKVNGHGIVELDALEALHPGTLADLVRHAVRRFRDPGLSRRLGAAERDAEAVVSQQWEDVTWAARAELDEISEAVAEISDRYRDRLEEIAEEMAADLDPYQRRLDALEVRAVELADAEFDLPARPDGERPDVDTAPMLYDSRRPWREQLRRFHAVRDGGDA